jgi:hypothetical protein
MTPEEERATWKADREFWLIILTTWEMWEIEAQEAYAEACEKSTRW